MSDKKTINAEQCRSDYQFYKERGICVSCHNEQAMIGAVRCPECAEKLAKRDAMRYGKLTADPTYRPKVSEYRKQLRQRRREAGICHVCGKRPAAEGYARCNECLIANRRKKDKRYNNDIPRNERPDYGLCYVCAEPVLSGFRLCEKHYTRLVAMAIYYVSNPTLAILERREYFKRLNNLIFVNTNKKEAQHEK